jgi:hypothetical protein
MPENPRFLNPPDHCRPLQFTPPFEQWCGTAEESTRINLKRLRDLGMRGLVVHVSLENYLCSDVAWDILRRGVRMAAEMGFRVWIYDEKGYPSGAAGGLVLAQFPGGEAQGLVRSARGDGNVKYDVVRLYEGTHATENFYQKRPYINILDSEAVSTFVQVTHDRYARALHPIGQYVEAFFTDEPSLIAAYVPQGKSYPRTLPWHPRLPEIFLSRKGYDLMPHLESLFESRGEIDRKVRCDFYEVIADLCAETYFGQIQSWCRRNGVLSSGHLLGEETLVWQTLFEGDPFACYRRFDIPGIDMILSDPGKIMSGKYFIVPKLGSSASRLQGTRRLMCEISDFLGAFNGQHATLEQMQCTASLLTAMGVTDFVSMYQPPIPPPAGAANDHWPDPKPPTEREFRAYADHAARVQSMFAEGSIETCTAVVHPLRTIWAHFTPSDRSMYDPHPDATIEAIDRSFTDLCRNLIQRQMDFDIVDEHGLSLALVEGETLVIGDRRYKALVLPPMDTVRLGTMETIARFSAQGGLVVMHSLAPEYSGEGSENDEQVRALAAMMREGKGGGTTGGEGEGILEALRSRVPPNCGLLPSSQHILCVRIRRREGPTYFLVNTSSDGYRGICTFPSNGNALILDPASGTSRDARTEAIDPSSARMALTLDPYQAMFVVFLRKEVSV